MRGSCSESSAERQKLKQAVVKRKAFRYYLKGLEKKGPVAMDHLTSGMRSRRICRAFIQAHVARFQAGGRDSNLASAERQAFLTVLAELLSGAGWLVLTRLLVAASLSPGITDLSLAKLVLLPADI